MRYAPSVSLDVRATGGLDVLQEKIAIATETRNRAPIAPCMLPLEHMLDDIVCSISFGTCHACFVKAHSIENICRFD